MKILRKLSNSLRKLSGSGGGHEEVIKATSFFQGNDVELEKSPSEELAELYVFGATLSGGASKAFLSKFTEKEIAVDVAGQSSQANEEASE